MPKHEKERLLNAAIEDLKEYYKHFRVSRTDTEELQSRLSILEELRDTLLSTE